jgi:inner membrane protein
LQALDNVTHTLIGALLGESAVRNAPPAATDREAKVRRTMFLAVMIVGSNLPDSDLLYSLGSGGKLAYLLEHRGHTHTVIGALVATAAMLVACALWQRLRGTSLLPRDRIRLVALALLAPLLHVAMDALNSYGVHPWWPFDNRWFYGDSVFIVEPLFWASAASLAFLLRSYIARGLVVLALLGGLYLAFVTEFVAAGSIAVFCALVVAMLALGRMAPPRVALSVAIGAWLATTVVFAIASRQAVGRVDAYAAAHLANWTTMDRVLTPLPMNPLCWEVILIQTAGGQYALRRAIVSIAPSLQCPTGGIAHVITAPLQNVALPDTPFLQWRGEILASRDRLRALAATSCEVAAFLRFSRAPWWSESDERRAIGDLRYDREPELGFAELDLNSPRQCPAYVPPWVPPRSDVLKR